MPSIWSKTRQFSWPTWPCGKTVLCGLSLKENQKSFATSSCTSAIRYQSLYENRNSWNLLWLERKSPALQKDCSRLTALCDFPGWSAAREAASDPFWSHVPLQPPHQIPTPPVKQFPSTLARLSDAALLVLASNATPWGLRWLQDYHSSHTQAANLHPHLGKEVSQGTSLLPSLQCSFCRASSRVTLPRYCTKSSKQDHKMGIVSFKLQTWELRLREQRSSGHHCKDSQDSSLDLSYSKEHAFPSNTMSRISPAIKPFMDQPSTLVLERSMAWPYLISLTLLQLFPFTNILKSHTSPGFLCSSGRNILATRSSALHI